MIKILLFFIFAIGLHAQAGIPDIPPDVEGRFYNAYRLITPIVDDGLEPVIEVGIRNNEWLEHINSLRGVNDKLSFSDKSSSRGYPMDAPSEYSAEIVLKGFVDLKSNLPVELGKVLLNKEKFTDQSPIDTAEYLQWGLKIDRLYQTATRWRMMSPWLGYLEQQRRNDIRGIYFLNKLPERENKLREFKSVASAEQAQIREWLIGMCFNSFMAQLKACENELDGEILKERDLNNYFEKYLSESQDRFDSFFKIEAQNKRTDFTWETLADGSSRLVAPFEDPGSQEVRDFLQINIQDEWRFGNWRLELPFVPEDDVDRPYVVFEPDVTPNVESLGGSRITMNSRQPLTEYDAQWVIRHEYGHVLGLTDCYVEFYIPERNVILNYQIDVDNIMCSRKGHVKEENFQELKRIYK